MDLDLRNPKPVPLQPRRRVFSQRKSIDKGCSAGPNSTSSQMVTYTCNQPRELPGEFRTSWGEYCLEAQKSRGCSIGNAAKSSNELLTSEPEQPEPTGTCCRYVVDRSEQRHPSKTMCWTH